MFSFTKRAIFQWSKANFYRNLLISGLVLHLYNFCVNQVHKNFSYFDRIVLKSHNNILTTVSINSENKALTDFVVWDLINQIIRPQWPLWPRNIKSFSFQIPKSNASSSTTELAEDVQFHLKKKTKLKQPKRKQNP